MFLATADGRGAPVLCCAAEHGQTDTRRCASSRVLLMSVCRLALSARPPWLALSLTRVSIIGSSCSTLTHIAVTCPNWFCAEVAVGAPVLRAPRLHKNSPAYGQIFHALFEGRAEQVRYAGATVAKGISHGTNTAWISRILLGPPVACVMVRENKAKKGPWICFLLRTGNWLC